MNKLDLYINASDIVNNKLEKIKEIFIKFYGERYRLKIEDSLNNFIFIPYLMPKQVSYLIKDYEKEVSVKYQTEFLTSINQVDNKNFFKDYSFSNKVFIPLNQLYELIDKLKDNSIKEWEFQNLKELLSSMLKIEINDNNINDSINYFLNIKPSYLNILEKYNEEISKYKELKEEINSYEESVNKLNNDYNIIFFELIEQYLSEKDKEYIKKCKEQNQHLYIFNLECDNSFCDLEYYSTGLIDYFNEDEISLNDESISDWKKQIIKKKRIEYFKLKGLDLGNNYDDYMNYPDIKSFIPTKELIDEIKLIKEELTNRGLKKQFELTPLYKKFSPIFDNLGLATDNFSHRLLLYGGEVQLEKSRNIMACVSPGLNKDNNLLNLLYLQLKDFDALEHFLVHELNHVVESSLIYQDEKQYMVKSGFDALTNAKIDEKVDLNTVPKRDFEYLNEIINELLAQDIHKLMNQEGLYLFNEPGKSKTSGFTSYENVKIFVEDFYHEFKDILFESRLLNNMDVLTNEVGYDNLVDLNNLIKNFFVDFQGFSYYQVIKDIKDKVKNESTELYFEYYNKSRDILNKMKEYKDVKNK